MTALSTNELACWLALLFVPGIGPNRFLHLLASRHTPADIIAEPDRVARELPAGTSACLRNPDWHRVEHHLNWAQAPTNHIITLLDPRYPAPLKHLSDAPPVLFVSGDPTLLQLHQLALVGSRNPTIYGRENAFNLAWQLAIQGYSITSGLAQGIDAAAHRGALHHPEGTTVAVLGTGLDRVYPHSHRVLAQTIIDRGALVSEFPLATAPHPGHFPRRNRIISGLSVGIIVVQATLRSGSLITARLALEQGREVFAVPGSIHDPKSSGCHHLIKQGAKLVERYPDILSELNQTTDICRGMTTPNEISLPEIPRAMNGLTPEQAELLENISSTSVSIDEVINRSGLTPAAVSSILLVLELQGFVTGIDGRYTRLR